MGEGVGIGVRKAWWDSKQVRESELMTTGMERTWIGKERKGRAA